MGGVSRLPYGGKSGEKHYTTIKCTTYDYIGKNVTCSNADVGYSKTATFGSDGTAYFVVNDWGTYRISCEGSISIVNATEWYATYTTAVNAVEIVTWADGTWEQISAMLTAHYNGDIDISDYWAVGDTREGISLTAMSGTSVVGENQAAQNIDLVIIGINHDDLSDGSGKAAITVQQKNSLNTVGYMNPSNMGIVCAKWTNSQRRAWCNSIYFNAIPEDIRNLIKTVNKVSVYATGTSAGNISTETTTDQCFLISNWEIFASSYNSYITQADGTQYDYYKTISNRVKNVGSSASNWWTRSACCVNNYAYFIRVYIDGKQDHYHANYNFGIAPAFCL